MSRLRLRHSSTPARLYDVNNWGDFERNGEVTLVFMYNGIQKDFRIGYTRPYKDIAAGVFANVINLNQNRNTCRIRQSNFQEWQNLVTHNGTMAVDIINFTYTII
jgi:hypothetical protein